jgi:hypothetical protein
MLQNPEMKKNAKYQVQPPVIRLLLVTAASFLGFAPGSGGGTSNGVGIVSVLTGYSLVRGETEKPIRFRNPGENRSLKSRSKLHSAGRD